MPSPGFRNCPACAEEIREEAKICRYCGAILTAEPLPDFVPEEVLQAWDAHERRLEAGSPKPGKVADTVEVHEAVNSLFEEVGVDISLQQRQRLEKFLTGVTEQYRSASVMFVDMKSYTSLCHRLKPEQIKSILDAYYSVCMQAVDFYNGFVVKFQGDGCLAVFGAPVAYDHDAESAVRAAMQIRQRVSAFPLLHGEKIHVSVGVETGEVLSSVVRSGAPTYDIFGPAVNLAARIQGVSEADTVLIGPATHDLVRKAFRFSKKPPRQLKNVEGPVVTYEVVAAKRKLENEQSRLAPLVGRKGELQLLESAWSTFAEGLSDRDRMDAAPSGMALAGESGVGKTRLIGEFAGSRGEGARCFKVESSPHDAKVPWGMWRLLFRSVCGATGGETDEAVRKKVVKLMTSLEFLGDGRVNLLALLGDKAAIQQLSAIPPAILRNQVAASIRSLLERLAQDCLLLIILDDLQWADQTSLEVLDSLLAPPAPQRCFFLLAHRADFHLTAANLTRFPRLDLHDLEAEHRKTLFDALLADSGESTDLPGEFVSQAPGNPFHIMELARTIQDRLKTAKNSIERQKVFEGAAKLVPLSVKTMLQSRVDGLEPRKKQVLQCASVLGRRFAYATIELFPFIRDGLLANLYALKSQDLLNDHTEDGELEFSFEHSAVREVAYYSLLDRQRRDLHRMIAEKVEARHPRDIEGLTSILAFHYGKTDEHEKASTYLKSAGDRAVVIAATQEALQNYDEALGHMALVESPERFEDMRIETLRVKGRMHYLSGDAPRAIETLDQGVEIAGRLKRRHELARLHTDLGYAHYMKCDYEVARSKLEAALPIARREKDMPLLGRVWILLGMCAWGWGNFKKAREHYTKAVDLALETIKPELAADASNDLALTEWKLGRLEAASIQFMRALELYRVTGNKFGVATVFNNLAIIEDYNGKYKDAEEHFGEALKLAEQIRFRQIQVAAHGSLANLCLACERALEACAYSKRSLELAECIGDRRSSAIALENLSLGYLMQREFERARRHLREGRKIAKEIGDSERLFSLSLVDIEIDLMSGARVTGSKLSRAMADLATGGYDAEKPRLLRLVTWSHLLQRQFAEAKGAGGVAIDVAVEQHNHTEESRIRKLLHEYENDLQTARDAEQTVTEDQVKIVEFDPGWSSTFKSEALVVSAALGSRLKEAHHVGSTAVPGVAAKPLVDILAAVERVGPIEEYQGLMAAVGYTIQPIDDTGRHCFKKGLPRTHHVHIVELGGRHYRNMLEFRDYLRTHPETAAEYVEVKRALAREFGKRRELYTVSKTAFIEDVLARIRGNEGTSKGQSTTEHETKPVS